MAGDIDEVLARTRAQIAKRRELDDQLATPRRVEHFAYFRRAARARAAGDALRSLGYDVEIERSGLRHQLLATRLSSVEPDVAEAFVREVHGIVVAHGGDYDGWGGMGIPRPVG